MNGIVDVVAQTCTTCHGTAGVNSAPPVSTTGGSATTLVSVGAHQAHVASTLRPAIACTECHGAASASYTTTHADGTVQTSFGTLSNQGTTTVWTRASGTCASNYCHGGTTAVAGGTGTTPVWTTVNGTFKACASCHGNPPALNATTHHPANPSCATCHGAGYTSTTVAAATHVNGTVNLSRTGCTLCHGDLAQTGVAATSAASAPGFNATSADSTGATAATVAGVGAHAAHLVGTRWRGTALACNECHTVPAAADVAHATGTGTGGARATVIFGTLARTGGITTATYAGSTTAANGTAAGTCSNTYCHGNFAGSGATGAISWTGGVAAASCGTCHGSPPPAPHVQNSACGSCHTGYTSTTVNATAHLNGVVNVTTMTCTSCHGDTLRTGTDPNIAAMPPVGTAGETLTTQPAVGAHLAHLTAGALARAFACTDCHNPPLSTNHATGTTTFSWSVLAGGGAVTYNFTNQTCSSTYCHGNFAGGNAANAPSWIAGTATVACGSCHGTPGVTGAPPLPHSQNAACGSCHVGYTATTVNTTNHVNGIVDVVAQTCTTCHGTAGVNAAPPVSTTGGSATTLVSVGAHQAHVASTLRPAIACTECHGAASAGYTTTHADGTVQTSFGTLSNQGTTTVWTRASGTCASNYCHGGTTAVAGGTGTTPVWTTVNGTFKACASCHGNPPALNATTHHPANPSCATCHGAGYTSTTVAAATHVNGTVNLSRTGCTLCHGDLAQTGVAATSAASAPGFNATSADSTGATAATVAGVGAHAAHLVGTRWRGTALACNECHTVPAAADVAHATGTGTGGARATVIFGTLARTGGITTATYAGSTTAANGTAAGTCSNTYCHGNFAGSGATGAISWTGGVAAASCGTCHGIPPLLQSDGVTAHSTSTACGSCHGTLYTTTTVDPTIHMNGRIDGGGGHPAGWKEPNQHGLAAMSPAQGGIGFSACTACHTGFGPVTGGGAVSDCNGCHATPATFGPFTTGTYPNHANWQTECTFCHGGRGGDVAGAPPRNTHVISTDLTTAQPTTDPTIGAHASHTQATHAISGDIACTACHQAVTNITTPGHVDNGLAEVTFAAVGTTVNPGTYTRPSCAANYCHGNFTGGASASLSWTGTFGATFTLTCTSCHGSPPGPISATVKHPQSAVCGDCHAGFTSTSVTAAASANHVDGTVNRPTGCTACHGELSSALAAQPVASGSSFAAPGFGATATSKDSKGNSATTARGVGLHNVHLTGGRSKAVACGECHTVPPLNDVAHVNGGNGLVAFSATLANKSGGATYASTTTLTCSSTYCHGNFTGGTGTAATPAWTLAGTLGCTSCHANPPPASAGHPQNTNCVSCHGPGYSLTTVNAATHVDGIVTLVAAESCTSCHGQTRTGVSGSDPNVAASPPDDSKGNAVATAVGVGAHLPHVNQSRTTPLSSPFACGVCHPPVAANRHADGTSQVTFIGLAVTGGITTAGYTSPSCTATYCHGNFAGGTGSAAPAWNVNGAQLACTSCHGSPPVPAAATASVPASYHPNNPTCSSCHPAGYTATAVTGTAIPTHVNGLVTLNANRTGCVQCHGTPGLVANDAVNADPNVASAPPSDSRGNAVATSAGVGAHVAHVNHATAGRLSLPIHCTECHGLDKTDRTHADGNSAPIFGTIARTGNVSPTYTSPNCSSTYCHGNFTGGTGTSSAPPWTTAGQLTCNACHGVGATAAATPPGPTSATLHHPQNANCVACHPGYSTTTVNATTHVDGVVNKPTGCTACHGDLTATGVANTDVRAAPAANANATDTRGSASTATNVRGIGAHARHLTGTAWRSTPMACSECHTVPAAGSETHVTAISRSPSAPARRTSPGRPGPASPPSRRSGTAPVGRRRSPAPTPTATATSPAA